MASSKTQGRVAKLVALALALLVGGCAALGTATSDKDRERRWAEQILPTLVVGEAVYLPTADDNGARQFLALYTPAETSAPKGAVILVHGKGMNPDFGIIGALRVALASHGYATLSLQMPVLRDGASDDQYQLLFQDAGTRIVSGVGFLRLKRYSRILLLSHSMGGRMADYYLMRASEPAVAAWVSLSISNGEYEHAQSMQIPILDVYAESDLPRVLEGAGYRAAVLQSLPHSRQVRIRGADHFYTGHEKEVLAEVLRFADGVR